MNNKPVLNYRIVLAIALVLLSIRIPLGQFFVSASDLTNENISRAINQERTDRNLPALAYNTKLAAAADYKAHDMINRHYFSHTDPEGNYIWDKIVQEGYTPYVVLGENLAIEFSDTAGLVAAWMDSPTHRANVLNAAFKDQGMGVAFGDTSAGQYDVAIANTFGAQPVVTQKTTTPTTTTQQPAPAKTTTTPKPVAQTPKPAPTQPTPAPTKTVEQPAPTEPIRTQPAPVIAHDSVKITPSVENGVLNLAVQASVSGPVQTVSATLLDKTVAMTPSNGVYSAVLGFEKYFNYQNSTVLIKADDGKGNVDVYSAPLSNNPLPANQNPKSVSLQQTLQSPDLYNVFKYIVIIFGMLFLIFLLGDALHFKKIRALTNINIGSNVIIIFLLLSTLLLVNWWH